MNQLKNINQVLITYLLPISLIIFGISLLFVEGYIAISSISLVALIILLFLSNLCKKEISKSIPNYVIISILSTFLILVLGIFISNGYSFYNSATWIKRWAMFCYCGMIFYLLPKQPKIVYFLLLVSFILVILSIDMYVFYKYYQIIIIDKGTHLPESTWINFIDLMGIYILPFRYTHHTLAFFNIFAISLSIYLIKLLPKYTYFLILFSVLMILMVHFYSSRMAIFVMYILAGVYAYSFVRNFKYKFITFVSVLLLLILSLSILINKIPTLGLKVEKLKTELKFYQVSSYEEIKNGPEYRLKSYFIAFDYLKNNFWKGIGLSNMGEAFEHDTKPYPLNNYLYLAVAIGVPCAILIFIFHFFPFIFTNIFCDIGLVIATFYVSLLFYSAIDAAFIMPVYIKFLAFWGPALQHIKLQLDPKT